MKQRGSLIVMSGPSGTGKGTICKKLLQQEENLYLSVSATTRQPRDGETEGVHYFFLSRDKFETMIADGLFLEWAKVYDNYYGTPLTRVRENIDAGRNVLLEIDPQGALQIKEKFPEAVFIYILPPSLAVLRARISGRGTDSADNVARRLSCAVEEISYADNYDYVVVNDDINDALAQVVSIIEAAKCRLDRQRKFIYELIKNKGE